jgi:hypothetical protein
MVASLERLTMRLRLARTQERRLSSIKAEPFDFAALRSGCMTTSRRAATLRKSSVDWR